VADLLMAGDERSSGGTADGRRWEERQQTCRWPATGGAAVDLPTGGPGAALVFSRRGDRVVSGDRV
jgi:hypothetical protein